MSRLLFAADGSEASLRAARGLAGILRWWKATDVEVLNVQPEPSILAELVPHSLRGRAESRMREEGERAWADAHALLQAAAARCATTVHFGDAATAIAHAAETLHCAIIAMGSHGAGAVGTILMGSVTTKVIRIASRPVLVIPTAKPQATSDYGPPRRPVRVLVPVDGSAGALAAVRSLLGVAPWFLDAPEIHLLAAYESTPLEVEIAAMISAEALREHQRKRVEAALAPAREALSAAGFEAVEHVAIGPVVEGVRATAAAEGCDLVCLGTRGAGAVGQLIVGSTAAKVLRTIEVPVLVVPPGAS